MGYSGGADLHANLLDEDRGMVHSLNMSYRTAGKTKAKASNSKGANLGKKGGQVKTFQYGKGSKKRKSMVYGAHKSLARKMHDHGPAVMAAGGPAGLHGGIFSTEENDETELAEELVSRVAETTLDVNALCETYGLRREELGRLTGFSLRALAGWAAGELPSLPAKRRLQEVRRLLDALAEIVKRESIPEWLHQPNPAFDRLTPLQAIEVGEIDRLWAMVHDLGSGQPE